MLTFSPLRTTRLSIQLKELSFSDAIHLCGLPADLSQQGITELLRRIVTPGPARHQGAIDDPLLMTVQERAMIVAHYTSHIAESGSNFAIGDAGRLSDYLIEGRADYPAIDAVDLGEIGGHQWIMRPLLGVHAECIELLVMAGKLPPGRLGWWMGGMAAQLQCDETPVPDYREVGVSALEAYIAAAAKIIGDLPASTVSNLLLAYISMQDALDHLFHLNLNDQGVTFLPLEGGAGLPPARFRVAATIPKFTKDLFGNPR